MEDIRRLDWSGKTVVLSACDTSVGPVHLGEGVLSLARAFFAGGASAVLGTLSEVRDDEQRDLFRGFYAELRGGAPVEDALRQAKQKLIRTGAPPASWANVILLGDGKIVPRAPDPPWRRPLVVVGSVMAAAVALLVLGLRTRRRRNGASSA
jgi:hypothetical protein